MSIDPKAMEAARRIVDARALLAGEGNNATAAAVPIDPWQPISTAPKDGTEIWAYTTEGDQRIAHWEEEQPSAPDDPGHYAGWMSNDGSTYPGCFYHKPLPPTDAPTHWQPLPEPPAENEADEKAGLTQASDSLARPSSSPSPAVRDGDGVERVEPKYCGLTIAEIRDGWEEESRRVLAHFDGQYDIVHALLKEITRLRAERPGWAEAIEAAAKVVDDARGTSFDLRSIRDEIRALHPSVAEGGEDNSSPAKSGPV